MFKAAERDDASDPLVEAAKDAVRWHDEVRDVQARQQLVVERACRLAESAGFDWILHVDADELLYFPDAACRNDAPAWFAAVPDGVEQVHFHNLECIPEALEVDDIFEEVTLFKVNEALFAGGDDDRVAEKRFERDAKAASTDEKRLKLERRSERRLRWMARRRRKGKRDSECYENKWLPGINTPVYRRRVRLAKGLNLDLPEPKGSDESDATSESSEAASDSDAEPKDPDKKKSPRPETFMHFNASRRPARTS